MPVVTLSMLQARPLAECRNWHATCDLADVCVEISTRMILVGTPTVQKAQKPRCINGRPTCRFQTELRTHKYTRGLVVCIHVMMCSRSVQA